MDLNELKQIWRDNQFSPKKNLGQNFLIDKNIREKILKNLSLTQKSTVLEIGPGFGVMSIPLAGRCKKLFAVEKDDRICEIMKDVFLSAGNIDLICGDIIKLDLCKLTKKNDKITVYGNIPYYISTPVIVKTIEQRSCIDSVYIVMQEELADRIVSPPGSKKYGSISCFVQFYSKAEKLFRITKNCFLPKPKVESCLLKLKMYRVPKIKVKDEDLMFKIIRKAFSQRRKKMINPLSDKNFLKIDKQTWQKILETCEIDPSSRAEDLSLEKYAKLADYIVKKS